MARHGDRSRAATRAALVLVGVAVGVVLAEAAARILLGPPPAAQRRALFFSDPSWRFQDGILRYAPRERVRSVALYGRRIEYDVRFDTNDLGFVDLLPYGGGRRAQRHIAVIGDSFVAGFHGGEPWLPALRDRLRARGHDLHLYNLGVGGTGLREFAARLEWARKRLPLDRVLVLFLSDDVERPRWRPLAVRGRLVQCPLERPEARCRRQGSRIGILRDPETPAAALVGRTRDLVPPVPARSLHPWLARHSQLGARLLPPPPDPEPDEGLDVAAWLDTMARHAGGLPLCFVQMPEKHESRTGRLDRDLAVPIRAAGFGYQSLLGRCPFDPDHYLPRDSHPNARGYQRLAGCLEPLLLAPEEGCPGGQSPAAAPGSGAPPPRR